MSDVAIRIDNVSKQYRIGKAKLRHDTLRDQLTYGVKSLFSRNGRHSPAANTIWALKDVSFEVKEGEVIGIIGRNGAGKSTLLKILSRISVPTEGRAEIYGRVGSLLEVGTGFHPELTGRENIYLNGAILGMRKKELDRKFDEIVTFAEIKKFIDTPVKFYSSGMYVRLAFAVAAHLEPEILLVDEVLAVGDAAFQKKCLGKIGQVAGEGRTVLVVSHNMAIIQKHCGRAVLLEQGRVVALGEALQVVVDYLADGALETNSAMIEVSNHPNRLSDMKPIVSRISLHAATGEVKRDFIQDEPVALRIQYDATMYSFTLTGVGFGIETRDGVRVGGFNSLMAMEPPHRIPSKGTAEFLIKRPHLTPGTYCVTVSLASHQGVLEDKIERVLTFDVHPADIYGTGYLLTAEDGVSAFDCEFCTG